MKRTKHYIVFIIMFFSFTNITHANVVINEIKLSPTEERFIELYNNGAAVDLTDWYIQRKTATGIFGSLVTKTNFEGKTIGTNSYFVISKNSMAESDIILDTLTLTESNTIQIKNADGNVVDKVGWGDTNDCGGPCVSNPTSSQSISRSSNGNFVIASPTPKAINTEIFNEPINDTTNESVDNNEEENIIKSSSSSSSQKIKIDENAKIITKIIAPKIVTAGVPFEIDHLTIGLSKEKIILGKFVWNFGDGMKKEVSTSDIFPYIYEYPGEYVLTLSFFDSTFDTKPDGVDRLTIKVIPSGISISSVGTLIDPYIEIENNSNYEISISKWILKGTVHAFIIPEGMVILSNKKLKLSPKITGFDFNDLSSISIIDGLGQVFAIYPKQEILPTKSYSNKNSQGSIVKGDVIKNEKFDGAEEVINLNDLGASAIGAGNIGDGENGLNNKTLIYLGLFGIIFIGMISIVLIRRKHDYPLYVGKELTAKDMTIIE